MSVVLIDYDAGNLHSAEKAFQRMAVETGIVTSDGVVIESGISGNEKIVLRAGGFLTAGETVNPRSASE